MGKYTDAWSRAYAWNMGYAAGDGRERLARGEANPRHVPHPVAGPPCSPACPGPRSRFHAAYAAGYLAAVEDRKARRA